LLAATVDALKGALGLRDPPTGAHCERVERLASDLGRRLRLGHQPLVDLAYAAELHDIGKVGLPDAVLLKPGPLLEIEWELVRRHSGWGSDLLRTVPGLERVAVIVRHHHEHFDGRGYPDRLMGDEIPVESRILSVVDAFVAMTEERPYAPARDPRAAAAELRAGLGSQFDPRVLDAFDAELQGEVLVTALSARA
jgi:HD-GYP domain-containing protein (c-di-GMP phosphodiesterase class II)